MEEEETKEESPEVKKERFLNKYKQLMEKDQQAMEQAPQQRPLSRAYLSLCPINKSQNKNVEEEKN